MNAFDDFSQTAYTDENTPTQPEPVLENFIGSRKSLTNIAS